MDGDNISLVLRKKNELCLEKRKIPEPGSHEALIAMSCVGICGSDVHFWKDGRLGDFIVEKPMVLGHESSGTVIKVGENVKHLKPGDRVCIEPGIGCGRCDLCRKGKYNICPEERFCATPPTDGTLCRYFCHDADFCYKLPDHVTLEEGALTEPLCVAVYSCRRAGVTAGQYVLICGAGPIGLTTILACKAMGVSKICITDINENRLKVAKSLGASSTICVKDLEISDVVKEVERQLGSLPDRTIECSGAQSGVSLGLKATAPGGLLMLVGIGLCDIKIPIIEATVREVDVRGSLRYANCYPAALELIASGAVDMKPLITHKFSLEESEKAFEIAHSGTAIKVMIYCEKDCQY
ncbi:sorbitol dehydrogenase-like isoform X2 [Parasteatoda tepidariorum]|uniref:sorbitol dehydrogenase-like isoform X1 n=1 Tax=Parasteatoda tepidariorum TaxID=114398 RepID=UPI001C728353|nr:sorbitol dehydrogenase-like isoform X1 [Parasteatoda tepidariorum]XP_042899707.1 sorbitol dehydrogenase-like isoform X2 [Parasteatoda tepidariorum]XP_042899711.1 sorbitol dehydrogenase-like isoform X2 [Parasteatoda tepidariorum]